MLDAYGREIITVSKAMLVQRNAGNPRRADSEFWGRLVQLLDGKLAQSRNVRRKYVNGGEHGERIGDETKPFRLRYRNGSVKVGRNEQQYGGERTEDAGVQGVSSATRDKERTWRQAQDQREDMEMRIRLGRRWRC